MSTSNVRFTFATNAGVKFDPTSIVLSDPDGNYGVKRNDNDAVVVADGAALTKVNTGIYEKSWTDPAYDLTYTAYAEYVIEGETYRSPKTIVGTVTPAAASTTRWTVDNMATHLQGQLTRDPATDGGSIPDRLGRDIREAGQWLWSKADWRFRWKQGTLTTVASTGTAAAPSDFGKLCHRWLRDPQTVASYQLEFFENPSIWQARSDLWDRTDSNDEQEPRYACVVEDTDESAFTWYFMLAPVPDKEYTYPFWYLRHDPWTLEVTDDDEVPNWPKEFDEGWYLRARYRVFQAYSKSDVWKDFAKDFRDWLKDHITENEETLVTEVSTLIDAYGDMNMTASHELRLDVNRKVRGWF